MMTPQLLCMWTSGVCQYVIWWITFCLKNLYNCALISDGQNSPQVDSNRFFHFFLRFDDWFFFIVGTNLAYYFFKWIFKKDLFIGCGGSLLQCPGFSLQWLFLWQNTALGMRASVAVACRLQSAGLTVVELVLSSATCGIFPD